MRTRKTLTAELGWAAVLGLALLALCYLRLWGDTGSAEFGGKIRVIEATFAQPLMGTALGNNVLLFMAAQITLHLGFALLCIPLARISKFAWRDEKNSRLTWLLLWFIAATVWTLVANATWFPTSSLGEPYADIAAQQWRRINLLAIASVVITGALAATLITAAIRLDRTHLKLLLRTAMPACIMLVVVATVVGQTKALATQSASAKPNIVIIGLDSLRFDAVQRQPTLTPAIDSFLKNAVTFSDATTPLARTFPSWVSLITGRHPHTTGAVVNLLPRELINTGETLPQMLHTAGYRSLYAIDEVRFSNLDLSYGFDAMVAPPIGATDFLLGFFNDTPLSNLVVNSWIGALLFPYTHANRAAALTYDPDTFVRRIDRNLPIEGPSLLAVHLTLAHWPYTWAGAQPYDDAKPNPILYYERAVARLDQQFDALMGVLEKNGVLENALVIVLSDHGEDLGSENSTSDATVDVRFDRAKLLGHGTSVFSRHQYHVVLAARAYGNTPVSLPAGTTIQAPVSLEDVTPTIADLLSLKPQAAFDGVSLLPLLRNDAGAAQALADRIRFTETEFNPPGLALGTFTSRSALRTAASYYRVDPVTDRVLLRQDDIDNILAKRQYAAFRGQHLLAAYPSRDLAISSLEIGIVEHGEALPTVLTQAMLKADPEADALWDALKRKFPSPAAQVVFAPTGNPPSSDP